MRKVAVFLVFVCASSSGAALTAQPAPGDLIIANESGFYGVAMLVTTPGSNQFSTLAAFPTVMLRGVTVGPRNTDFFAASQRSVFRVTAAGVVTTLVPVLSQGGGCVACVLDEIGELLVGTGLRSGALYRIHPVSGGARVVRQGFYPNAFCLDRDSGDIVVGDYDSSFPMRLLRIRRDGSVTTVATVGFYLESMEFHPSSGDVLVGSMGAIYRLDSQNRITTLTSQLFTPNGLAALDDGTIAVGGDYINTILRMDTRGKILGTLFSGGKIRNVCMAVADEHNLWGIDTPMPGTVFNLRIRFARHPVKHFLAAASFSPRPGFYIGGRWIPLTPDGLFFLSRQLPHVFGNFAGLLDRTGRASPFVVVPNLPALRGTRLFLAAVVLDPNAPGGIAQVSQEYGATIR